MNATATRERPLLYSGPMVRAILAGQKTQTRRVVKDSRIADCQSAVQDGGGNWIFWDGPARPGLAEFTRRAYPNGEGIVCPHGRPGDRLWVRETWALAIRAGDSVHGERVPHYRADGHALPRWSPSIHMPRWASRITLEIAEVRVERARDISDADILAEGIVEYAAGLGLVAGDAARRRELWAHLWDAVNGERDGGKWAWDNNPWTWVLSFRVLDRKEPVA